IPRLPCGIVTVNSPINLKLLEGRPVLVAVGQNRVDIERVDGHVTGGVAYTTSPCRAREKYRKPRRTVPVCDSLRNGCSRQRSHQDEEEGKSAYLRVAGVRLVF